MATAKKTVKKKAAKKVTKKATTKRAAKVAGVEVRVKVSGGMVQPAQATTLGELKKSMEAPNYQAVIDGEPQNDNNYVLTEGEFVTLTAPVKGSR